MTHVNREAITLEQWQTTQASLLADLAAWTAKIPPRGELDVREVYRREYHDHTEVKLTYVGEPGERIPAYLLIPRERRTAKLPAILAAHQCACQCDIGKEQVVGKCVDWPDQAYGLELVRQGYVVLAPDANKVGERWDPTLREPWERCTPNGIEEGGQNRCCTAPGGAWGPIRWKPVFDVMRGIDLLCEHPLVDPERIGIIGHSLGADTIAWTMPLEPRIAAAVISGGGLVDLPFRPYGLPYADILKVIAPRPFFEVTGIHDYANCGSDDPNLSDDERMAKKRAAHASAQTIYALLGHPERLARHEHDGGHCFPVEARRAGYDWLNRWLRDAK